MHLLGFVILTVQANVASATLNDYIFSGSRSVAVNRLESEGVGTRVAV